MCGTGTFAATGSECCRPQSVSYYRQCATRLAGGDLSPDSLSQLRVLGMSVTDANIMSTEGDLLSTRVPFRLLVFGPLCWPSLCPTGCVSHWDNYTWDLRECLRFGCAVPDSPPALSPSSTPCPPLSWLGNLLTSLSVLPPSASTEALSLSVLSLTASRPCLY